VDVASKSAAASRAQFHAEAFSVAPLDFRTGSGYFQARWPEGPNTTGGDCGLNRTALLALFVCSVSLLLAAAGCGVGAERAITADGSFTVAPFVRTAAEGFNAASDVNVDVDRSGTGDGFERFCDGDTDLSNASRPIAEDEQGACGENGVEYVELRVATDAITNIVNTANDWATCLTVEQLKAIWEPESTITSWKQIDPSFPDVPLTLFGPGTESPAPVSRPSAESATFDYFTGEIVGEVGASRGNYRPSEDQGDIPRRVSRKRGGLGYSALRHFEANRRLVKTLAVDDGHGCVAPTRRAAYAGTYTPLSRPLFVYVKRSSLEDKDDVRDFVNYMVDNCAAIAQAAGLIPPNAAQLAQLQARLRALRLPDG
jgi:phosphate transport system substrate-binding protein